MVRVVHAMETETFASPYSQASRTPVSVSDKGGIPAGSATPLGILKIRLAASSRQTCAAIQASARLLRRATAIAIAIEARAIRAGAAKLLKFFPQLRASAVERDAGVVGGHAKRDRGS